MEPALPVEYIDFDRSVEETGDISNMSAEQYLSWVRCQADSLPMVTRAEIDSSIFIQQQTAYMPVIASIPDCAVEYLPNEKWERDILFIFSDLRSTLEEADDSGCYKERVLAVPQLKDEAGWCQFCLGVQSLPKTSSPTPKDVGVQNMPKTSSPTPKDVHDESNENEIKRRKLEVASMLELCDNDNNDEANGDCPQIDEEEAVEGIPLAETAPSIGWEGALNVTPTIRLLLQFDQVLTQRLLTFHVCWLEDSSNMAEKQCLWLYALLARLDKPLDQDMASLIRKIFRLCSIRRAVLTSVGKDHSSDKTEEHSMIDELSLLNTLICISGCYFRQGESYVGDPIEDVDEKGLEGNENGDRDDVYPSGFDDGDCSEREEVGGLDSGLQLPLIVATNRFNVAMNDSYEDGECDDDDNDDNDGALSVL